VDITTNIEGEHAPNGMIVTRSQCQYGCPSPGLGSSKVSTTQGGGRVGFAASTTPDDRDMLMKRSTTVSCTPATCGNLMSFCRREFILNALTDGGRGRHGRVEWGRAKLLNVRSHKSVAALAVSHAYGFVTNGWPPLLSVTRVHGTLVA